MLCIYQIKKNVWAIQPSECTLKKFHFDQACPSPYYLYKTKKLAIYHNIYVRFLVLYRFSSYTSFNCFTQERKNKKVQNKNSASDNLSIHLIPAERFIIGYFSTRYLCHGASSNTITIRIIPPIVCIGYHIKQNYDPFISFNVFLKAMRCYCGRVNRLLLFI